MGDTQITGRLCQSHSTFRVNMAVVSMQSQQRASESGLPILRTVRPRSALMLTEIPRVLGMQKAGLTLSISVPIYQACHLGAVCSGVEPALTSTS